ncbi:MAG TPA: Flp pilus assembly protein CpaB [Actinomycetota bacterium]
MRRTRPIAAKALAAVSILVAVGATLVLRGHLVRLEARARTPSEAAPVVVAASPLPRGMTLAPSLLRVERIPPEYRPPGALSSIAEAAGMTLAADVAEGEVLTQLRLSRGGPLAAALPPGYRAVTVPVSLPPGALARGDRVDVLATFGGGRAHAETVASELEVLQILAGETGVLELVLLASPDTAERLAYARAFAELSVAIVPGRS